MFQIFKKKLIIHKLLEDIKRNFPSYTIFHLEHPEIRINGHSFYSYRIALRHKNSENEVCGWGSSKDKGEAILKALMELTERLEVSNYLPLRFKSKDQHEDQYYKTIERDLQLPQWISLSTSGCAIHFDRKEAHNGALNELLERHIILTAIARDQKPYLLKEIPFLNTKIEVWVLETKSLKVVINRIPSTNSEGHHFHIGTGKTVNTAIDKAILESTPLLSTLLEETKTGTKYTNQSGSNIGKNEPISSIQNFYLNNKIDSITDFFNKQSVQMSHEINLELPFYFHEYENRISPDLTCVRYVSPMTQPLFFGKWDISTLNPRVIKSPPPKWAPFIN